MAKVYEALEGVDEKGEPHPDMETVTEILTDLRNDQEILRVMIDQLYGIHGVMFTLLMVNMMKQ